MKIVCISDTHSLHRKMLHNLPEGDILVHAGDCTNMGEKYEVEQFVDWFKNIKGFTAKIFIAGNHDWSFQRINEPHHKGDYDWFNTLMNEESLLESNVIYLEDREYVINDPRFTKPIKIYGSPWQPEFFNWAFNLHRNGPELKEKWDRIPTDTGILITHGPPYCVRDFVEKYGVMRYVGCELLRERLSNLNVALSVHGHIHYAHGLEIFNNTMVVNASICTEGYTPINKPIVIELTEIEGELIANHV